MYNLIWIALSVTLLLSLSCRLPNILKPLQVCSMEQTFREASHSVWFSAVCLLCSTSKRLHTLSQSTSSYTSTCRIHRMLRHEVDDKWAQIFIMLERQMEKYECQLRSAHQLHHKRRQHWGLSLFEPHCIPPKCNRESFECPLTCAAVRWCNTFGQNHPKICYLAPHYTYNANIHCILQIKVSNSIFSSIL